MTMATVHEERRYLLATSPADGGPGYVDVLSWATAAEIIEYLSSEPKEPTKVEIELDLKVKVDTTDDPVNHPSHYTQGAVECIDAIESALGAEGFIAFLRGQVIKYTWRMLMKDDEVEDAKKAAWYQQRLINYLEQKS